MLRTSLCDYSDAYILVTGTVTVANTAAAKTDAKDYQKMVIFKKCVLFTSCMSRIHNSQIDDAQYVDVVMPMHNLIEYSDNYQKTSGILFQYCGDVSTVDNNGEVIAFTNANYTDPLNLNRLNINMSNRWQWYKKCWNNGTIKIS